MRERRQINLSDRAVKALQKVDRGKGKPVLVNYNTKELDGLVVRWTRDEREFLTLNDQGRYVLRTMRRPRRDD